MRSWIQKYLILVWLEYLGWKDQRKTQIELLERSKYFIFVRVCVHAFSYTKFIGQCYISDYMSPKYTMNGVISIKTGVFSFGVLLLEIMCSKKNNSHYQSHDLLNLIGYVSSSLNNLYMEFWTL